MKDVTGSLRLGDGRSPSLRASDSQLRHIGRVRASTDCALEGRTADDVIATMEAMPPPLLAEVLLRRGLPRLATTAGKR